MLKFSALPLLITLAVLHPASAWALEASASGATDYQNAQTVLTHKVGVLKSVIDASLTLLQPQMDALLNCAAQGKFLQYLTHTCCSVSDTTPLCLPPVPGSQTFTASGSFTVPNYATLTITVLGAGGGGTGTASSPPVATNEDSEDDQINMWANPGTAGSPGQASVVNLPITPVVAAGGGSSTPPSSGGTVYAGQGSTGGRTFAHPNYSAFGYGESLTGTPGSKVVKVLTIGAENSPVPGEPLSFVVGDGGAGGAGGPGKVCSGSFSLVINGITMHWTNCQSGITGPTGETGAKGKIIISWQ